jgi:DNA-binding GntR family transcriptional regulator
MFQKIEVQRQRLADKVYDQILEAINSGHFNPLDRIVQEKLAEQLQVSRTPIREALLRLEREGTLIASERGGFIIRTASRQEVVEIYGAREAIEGYCAAILAQNAKDSVLAKLERQIRSAESKPYKTVHSYYQANRQIHRAFVEATANQYLLEMFDGMWNRSLSFGTFLLMDHTQLRATLTGHTELVAAMRSRVPETAMRAMCDHIRQGMQLQLAALDRSAEKDSSDQAELDASRLSDRGR